MATYAANSMRTAEIPADELYFLAQRYRHPNAEGEVYITNRKAVWVTQNEASMSLPQDLAAISKPELIHWTALLELQEDTEYFISANTFRPGAKRLVENLNTINNLVLCISYKGGLPANFHHLVLCMADTILQEGCVTHLIPDPNSLVFTGDGLQLWWSFCPVTVDAEGHILGMRKRLLKKWIKTVRDILSKHPELCAFNVDERLTLNPIGLYRLPGTMNLKSNTMIEHEPLFPISYSFPGICEAANVTDESH